jgi:hypothetical protein
MFSLVTYLSYGQEEIGARVPIIEEVIKQYGKEIGEKIPRRGWSREDIHAMTDGTEYSGLGDFADCINHETGVYQLDASMEDGYAKVAEWDRETVEQLTSDGARIREIMGNIKDLDTRLEMAGEYETLLDFLIEAEKKLPKKKKKAVKKPKTLHEIFKEEGSEYGEEETDDERAAVADVF